MSALFWIGMQEVSAGVRNRWVMATTLALAALALSLALLGTAPTGTEGVDPVSVVVVSLASLSIFLIPLIALLLSFDAIVGELERGTLLLLMSYPIARWQIVVGKFLGQTAILAVATVAGYGLAGILLAFTAEEAPQAWGSFVGMIGTSILLGCAFIALGLLSSVVVRERATAAGLAVAIWLVFVLLYDTALLGLLVADQGRLVDGAVLEAFLLFNPADSYRLFNLAGSENLAALSGMDLGAGGASFSPVALVGALFAWTIVPLLVAVSIVERRQA